jgi:hypothetical protein
MWNEMAGNVEECGMRNVELGMKRTEKLNEEL